MTYRHALHWAILLSSLFILASCGGTERPVGSLCVADEHCGNAICVAGKCTALKACKSSAECANGVCNEGYCFSDQCGTDDPCPAGLTCSDGYCLRSVGSEKPDTSGTGTEDISIDKTSGQEKQCQTNTDCVGLVGQVGVCQEPACVNGQCQKVDRPSGSACDDGKFCSVSTRCNDSGQCVGVDRNCGALDGKCTVGVCDETKRACVSQIKEVGTRCDDGIFCTVGDKCNDEGVCEGSDPNPCVVNNQCQEGYCNTEKDACDTRPLPTSTPCKDANFCTVNDHCDGKGECTGGEIRECADAGDGVCMVGFCNADKQACDKKPAPVDTPCDDGQFCTVNDKCSADGTCGKTEPRNCDGSGDGKCVTDLCDEANDKCGKLADNGSTCSDDNVCTSGETCTDGKCGTGKPVKLGTPCEVNGSKYAMCGYKGTCVEWIEKTYEQPMESEPIPGDRYTDFTQLCHTSDKMGMYILGTYTLYPHIDASPMHQMQVVKLEGRDAKDLTKLTEYPHSYSTRLTTACDNGQIVGLYAPTTGPSIIGTDTIGLETNLPIVNSAPSNQPFFVYDHDGTDGLWKQNPNLELSLSNIMGGSQFGYLMMYALHDMAMVEGNIALVGQTIFQTEGSGWNYMVNCRVNAESPTGYDCGPSEIENLNGGNSNIWDVNNINAFYDKTSGVFDVFVTSSSMMQYGECGPFGCETIIGNDISIEPNGPSGTWFFSHAQFKDDSEPPKEWHNDAPEGCDGTMKQAGDPPQDVACYNGTPFSNDDGGWTMVHGNSTDSLYAVGTYSRLGRKIGNDPIFEQGTLARYVGGKGWSKLPALTGDAVKKFLGMNSVPHETYINFSTVRELVGGYALVQGVISYCDYNPDGELTSCMYNVPMSYKPFAMVYCSTEKKWMPMIGIGTGFICCEDCPGNNNYTWCPYQRREEGPYKIGVVQSVGTSIYLIGESKPSDRGQEEDDEGPGFQSNPRFWSWHEQ